MAVETLVSVAVGALLGFGGAGALQWQRHRREDRQALVTALGVARLVRAELWQAELMLTIARSSRHAGRHWQLPSAEWSTHRHLLLPFVADGKLIEQLVSAYSLVGQFNRAIDEASAGAPPGSIRLDEETTLLSTQAGDAFRKASSAAHEIRKTLERDLERREKLVRAHVRMSLARQ